MHFAADSGNSDIIKILFGNGAATDVVDNDRASPLHYAARLGFKEVVQVLLHNENMSKAPASGLFVLLFYVLFTNTLLQIVWYSKKIRKVLRPPRIAFNTL